MIFIKYGTIKGDCTAEGHLGSAGWVEVNSFQFGIGRGIASPTGGSKDRESTAPSISEIVITKPTDVSSVAWMEASLYGDGVKAQIDFCKTEKDALSVYMSYNLENAMISGYSVSSGGDRPSESISINFTKIEFSFVETAADSTDAETPRTSYDISKASAK
ncbi:MAG: type VI secretion system tube protein Hcp [Planctomycetes bacterium]|nr:type VI secretion system tube protein Hcp [Planctomycetota bacterium]